MSRDDQTDNPSPAAPRGPARGPMLAAAGVAVIAVAGGAFALLQDRGNEAPPAPTVSATVRERPVEPSPEPSQDAAPEPSPEPDPEPERDPGVTLESYPDEPSIHWQVKADEVGPGGTRFEHPELSYYGARAALEVGDVTVVHVWEQDGSSIAALDPDRRTVLWTASATSAEFSDQRCDGVPGRTELFCVKQRVDTPGGVLEVIDVRTGDVTATSDLEHSPVHVAATGDGSALVATVAIGEWNEDWPYWVLEHDSSATQLWSLEKHLPPDARDLHRPVFIDATEPFPVAYDLTGAHRLDRAGSATSVAAGTTWADLPDGSVVWGRDAQDNYLFKEITVDDGSGGERLLTKKSGMDVWSARHTRPGRPLLTWSASEIVAWDHLAGEPVWRTPVTGLTWADLVYTNDAVLFRTDGFFVAIDPRDGHELWAEEMSTIDVTTLSDGARFVFVDGKTLVALSARDGSVAWQRAIPGDAGDWPVASNAVGGRLTVSAGDTLTFFAP